MEPPSGIISCKNPTHTPTPPPATYVREAWILCSVPHWPDTLKLSKQEMELSKQEMELFKQEMELFHQLPDLGSKKLFYKMSLILTKEFIIDFQNRK